MPILQPEQLILDTYEVERFLAEGAFAEVYRVKHKYLGRQAMKVFKRTRMTKGELDEMMREAAMLSRMAHPNIVQVFDANTFTIDQVERGYFTMENVPGGSLDKFWRSHGARLVPLETSVDIIKQVSRGLILAHSATPAIIHRDIKPQNILIGYEADGLRAKLSDFGLAKRVNKLTLFATAAGTLAFKPPEVFTQAKGDSVAADIWALGVTLYMLLTDSIPFDVDEHLGWGNAEALRTPPPVPSQYNIEANSDLDFIVLKCLSPRPEDRYADARELLDALNAWKSNDKSSDKPTPSSASLSASSKDAFGHQSTPVQSEANSLIRQAIQIAKQKGNLNEAADMMEEAFNKWPSLREKHATKVTLWRRGISM